jgi:hypothetical protein
MNEENHRPGVREMSEKNVFAAGIGFGARVAPKSAAWTVRKMGGIFQPSGKKDQRHKFVK